MGFLSNKIKIITGNVLNAANNILRNRDLRNITIVISTVLVAMAVFVGVRIAQAASTKEGGAGGILNASSATISDIKIEPDPSNQNNNIIVIRSNQTLNYRIFALSQPTKRLVIDTERVQWKFFGNRSDAGSINGLGMVGLIRYAQKSDTESRIVLDLVGPVKVINQETSGLVGSKEMRITIAPSSMNEFASVQPLYSKKADDNIAAAPQSVKKSGKYVIVIDAGHGAHDPGASGFTQGIFEKNITLASALALRDELKKDHQFKVILTRDKDVFLPLEQRIVIARDLKADLFISLHADSAPPESKAQGATVYTLSEQGGQRSKKILNAKNWTMKASSASGDGTVTEILRDLTQRDTKNQSAIFAEDILQNIKSVGPVTSTSHRTAGFFVLLSPTVPAVLLEMGFVTAKDDEARLNSDSFRKKQMKAVAKAIEEYFSEQKASVGHEVSK